MVEISLYGSGEGPGWVTAPGYSTAGFSPMSNKRNSVKLSGNRGETAPRGAEFFLPARTRQFAVQADEKHRLRTQTTFCHISAMLQL